MSARTPEGSNGERSRELGGLPEDPNPSKPTRWPRLAAFFTGSECQGWHAACPAIRAERRRLRLAAEAGGRVPATDGPVKTSSYRTG